MRRVWDDPGLRCLVIYLMPLWVLLILMNLEAFGLFNWGLVHG